jgi:predicted nucleic-acid-binding protein
MIADTNLLVRAVLDDDPHQSRAARHALGSANQVVISRHAFCEMVWVLHQHYKKSKVEIINAVLGFLEADSVITESAAVQAGIEAMKAGADFADGVIAYEGRWLGGEEFVSFDKKAVAALAKQGVRAKLLK